MIPKFGVTECDLETSKNEKVHIHTQLLNHEKKIISTLR